MNYSWPGNIRELEHVIENAVVLSETKVLSNDDFPLRTHQNLSDEDLNLIEVEKKIILKLWISIKVIIPMQLANWGFQGLLYT